MESQEVAVMQGGIYNLGMIAKKCFKVTVFGISKENLFSQMTKIFAKFSLVLYLTTVIGHLVRIEVTLVIRLCKVSLLNIILCENVIDFQGHSLNLFSKIFPSCFTHSSRDCRIWNSCYIQWSFYIKKKLSSHKWQTCIHDCFYLLITIYHANLLINQLLQSTILVIKF